MMGEAAAVNVEDIDRPVFAAEKEERVHRGGFDAAGPVVPVSMHTATGLRVHARDGGPEREGGVAMRLALVETLQVEDVQGVLRVCAALSSARCRI